MEVRKTKGLKEASIQIGDTTLNIAVANGLNNAKKILEKVKKGKKQYHLVEIMACPGGCIGGGGQPYPSKGYHILDNRVLALRAKALYNIDSKKTIRKSHENTDVLKLYEEYFEHPGSKTAHDLLHTSYQPKQPKGIK